MPNPARQADLKSDPRHWGFSPESIATRDRCLAQLRSSDVEGIVSERQIDFWTTWRSCKSGSSALHYAAATGSHSDVVRTLIEMGADPSALNDRGDPPCAHVVSSLTARVSSVLAVLHAADAVSPAAASSMARSLAARGNATPCFFLMDRFESVQADAWILLPLFLRSKKVVETGADETLEPVSPDRLMAEFESRFGSPPENVIQSMIRAAASRKGSPAWMDLFWSNRHRPGFDWSPETEVNVLVGNFRARRASWLLDRVADGWRPSEKTLESASATLATPENAYSSFRNTSFAEAWGEFLVRQQHAVLAATAEDGPAVRSRLI